MYSSPRAPYLEGNRPRPFFITLKFKTYGRRYGYPKNGLKKKSKNEGFHNNRTQRQYWIELFIAFFLFMGTLWICGWSI